MVGVLPAHWPTPAAMIGARPAMLPATANTTGRAENFVATAFEPRLLPMLRSACKLGDVSPLQRTLLGHRDAVQSISYAPNGLTIASGSVDGAVILWDATSGRRLETLLGHGKDPVLETTFITSRLLATAGSDGWIVLWDTRIGSVVG